MAWIKRLALAIALLAILTMASALENTYGKTHAEILKMGRHKWFTFYTGKAGESTVDMCDAERIYGDCLAESNDRFIAKRKPTERNALSSLRKYAKEYGGAMVEVGMALTGGGTMWNPVEAGIQADAEELLSAVLSPNKRKPANVPTRAAVLAKFGSLRTEIVREGNRSMNGGRPAAWVVTPRWRVWPVLGRHSTGCSPLPVGWARGPDGKPSRLPLGKLMILTACADAMLPSAAVRRWGRPYYGHVVGQARFDRRFGFAAVGSACGKPIADLR